MFRRRTILSALVLSVAASSGVLAQAEVHFGVLAGGVFAKVGGSDATGDIKTRVGIAAGGFVTIGVSKNFAIEPEALFVQKGAKQEESGVTSNLKLSYVEVPVLLKLRFPGSGTVVPHVYAGPYLGFKAGCHLSGTDGTVSASVNCDEDPFNFKVKSTDFGATFGGGVDVGRAIIDVRYDLGFSKIGDDTGGDNDIMIWDIDEW